MIMSTLMVVFLGTIFKQPCRPTTRYYNTSLSSLTEYFYLMYVHLMKLIQKQSLPSLLSVLKRRAVNTRSREHTLGLSCQSQSAQRLNFTTFEPPKLNFHPEEHEIATN